MQNVESCKTLPTFRTATTAAAESIPMPKRTTNVYTKSLTLPSSYPLLMPGTPACRHRPRSARGSPGLRPSHRGQNPEPTPGSRLCTDAMEHSVGRSVCASCAAAPALPPYTPGARACGSPLLRFAAAAHADAGIRSAASPAPIPPDVHAVLRPSAAPGIDNSTRPPSKDCTLAAG